MVAAFSRRDLWDSDPVQHLNVHSSHQVIAALQGMLLVEDDAARRPLYQRAAAFIPAGKPHRVVAMHRTDSVRCYSLFFHPTLFPVPDSSIRLFRTSDLCCALLQKMNEHNLVDITGGIEGRCLGLFLSLLPEEMEHRCESFRLPVASTERSRRVIEYLNSRFSSELRLHQIAGAMALSERQLSRGFKHDMGITVMEYAKVCRLIHASYLLLHQESKIIDVAHDSGYASVSTFHRDFKRYFGVAPNRFRRSTGKPESKLDETPQ
ncbi:MAG: AraC family transcriptional regulator [Spirochaetaceae bacterium]|nr:MAG: AraC family transcriptional regulator [Spirochaetaceae bacterium]